MPSKIVHLPAIGAVQFVKSARSRSIRLSVTSKGGVRVSLPHWTPYAVATQFVLQHASWITDELSKHKKINLQEGQKIGKLHTLHFVTVSAEQSLRSKVTATRLVIPLHPAEHSADLAVQKRAESAALRALKREAEVVLPPRLKALAQKNNFTVRSVKIKQLKRRWGSCDSGSNIILNMFLMQLSWQQIDYVICHELAHIKHMNHSHDFWAEVEQMLPDARMIAKKVRHMQPALAPQNSPDIFDDDMAY